MKRTESYGAQSKGASISVVWRTARGAGEAAVNGLALPPPREAVIRFLNAAPASQTNVHFWLAGKADPQPP